MYNEVFEMGVDNKEMTVNFSSTYSATEAPYYIFFLCKV